jgi:hypothetical protein
LEQEKKDFQEKLGEVMTGFEECDLIKIGLRER